MIVLNKNAVNEVVLTLNEKSTLANPVYLFKFVNEYTRGEVIFIAQDISVSPERYNEFIIEDVVSEDDVDSLTGKVQFSPTGSWVYTVYEQTSSTNLDPDNATGVVETGKARVDGVQADVYVYEVTPLGPSIVFDDGLGVAIDPNGFLQIGANGLRISPTKSSNWDAAYGWGNHASAGYALASNLGTISAQNYDAVSITGGAINGTTINGSAIGATTRSTGDFTSLTSKYGDFAGTDVSFLASSSDNYELLRVKSNGTNVMRRLFINNPFDEKPSLDLPDYGPWAMNLHLTGHIIDTSSWLRSLYSYTSLGGDSTTSYKDFLQNAFTVANYATSTRTKRIHGTSQDVHFFGSGNIDNVFANSNKIWFRPGTSNQVTGNAYNYLAEYVNSVTTSYVNAHYGFAIVYSGTSGYIGTSYGLYLAEGFGATKYGVYQLGTTTSNVFQGSVSAGSINVNSGTATAKAVVRGAGNTSATSALIIQNSSNTELFNFRDDGYLRLGTQGVSIYPTAGGTGALSTAGRGLAITASIGSQGSSGLTIIGDMGFGGTGATASFNSRQSFIVTTGDATFAGLLLQAAINQTGTATGKTYGVHVNHTLTSAVDYTGIQIEMGVTSHYGLKQIGTNANNKFEGNLTVDKYVKFGSYTTTERNALTAANGMVIYNTTDSKFQGYAGGAWIDLH